MSNENWLRLLAQITLFLPLVVVAITVLITWWHGRKPLSNERLLSVITFLSSFLLLAISIGMLFLEPKQADFDFFTNVPLLGDKLKINFHIDALSVFMILLINLVAFAASWNSLAYLSSQQQKPNQQKPNWWQEKPAFHFLINLFHFTMLLVPLSNNLVVVWVAIELTTVGSAILIVYEGRKSSWEATWKYLIITSTGIVLALLGTIFLATHKPDDPILSEVTYRNELLNWTFLLEHSKSLDPKLVWFAFLFALVGYGTKAGLAPLHTWLPDGHGEAPAPISALLSGVLLKASFYVILRFYILTNAVFCSAQSSQNINPALRLDWTSYAFLIAGLLSLLMATPFIIKNNPFKRVLAYHSLEHMGIIAFGFGMGGLIAVAGALLHMLNHAITKALMFLAYGNIARKYEKDGIPIAGALRSMPWSGSLLTLGGLALVGTPPFNIFMSELIILWGALTRFIPGKSPEQPVYPKWIAGIAIAVFILSTTLIFYGLVNHLKKLVLGKSEKDVVQERPTWSSFGPVFFLFVLMLLFGIWIAPPLAALVYESVRIILPMTE